MSIPKKIEDAFVQAGKDPENLTIEDLAAVDQFHVRGAEAVSDIVDEAMFRIGSRFVDIGCGSGGPARLLADAVGCKISGYDLSEDAVSLGNALSARTGHEDKVDLSVADAQSIPVPDEVFDAGWSIHVGMFIEDKDALYREAFRVLKSGSPFVIFDPMLSGETDHGYPVPWARSPENNFICREDQLFGHLQKAGFKVDRVIDRTDVCVEWLKARAANASSPPSPLGLHLIVGPDFPQMTKTVAAALKAGLIWFPEIHTVRQ